MSVMRIRDALRDERGATSVVVALLMTVLLGSAALVIDVGAMQARKAELQDAADAAALAIAQECFAASPGTMIAACDTGVQAAAGATALELAEANVGDGEVTLSAPPAFTSQTVEVRLASPQGAFFAGIFDSDGSTIAARATAQWNQPATPLPLAFNECVLPDSASTGTVFLRYDLLGLELLGLDPSDCGILGGLLDDTLGAGWLADGDCVLDDGLLPYLSSTVTKILPTYCEPVVAGLVGRQVLLPVYDSALGDVVIDGALLNDFPVEGYALVEVTGYDFEIGVRLGIITLTFGQADMPATGPQCPTSLLHLTCQGIQGIYHGILTPAEAAQLLQGVRLID
jgi:hypothetical protein